MRQRSLLTIFASLALLLVSAPAAFAHGEDAQESFLRMQTVGWYNVTFEGGQPTTTFSSGGQATRFAEGEPGLILNQGDTVTIRGTVKILDTYPQQLQPPRIGQIGLVAPGPVITLETRTVNGVPAPHAIQIERGKAYNFEMTARARRAGEWHIHPSFAIKSSGTLLGPGMWFEIQDTGGFENPQTLYNGTTVDLENYGLGTILSWHWVGMLIGLAWLLYWIVPKPTVTRLAVTSQIPVNTDGNAIGLITDRDHRNMNIFAIVTVLFLAAGYFYQNALFPVKIPQQVVRIAVPDAVLPNFADAAITRADYSPGPATLSMDVEVTNRGSTPLTVTNFTSSTLTWDNVATTPGTINPMEVSPVGRIQPGDTRPVKITITDPVWNEQNLVPVGQSQMVVAGTLLLTDAQGVADPTEVSSRVNIDFMG